jgi:hypothetical protein
MIRTRREAVRQHERLGAAVGAGGEQLQGANRAGLEGKPASAAARGLDHGATAKRRVGLL